MYFRPDFVYVLLQYFPGISVKIQDFHELSSLVLGAEGDGGWGSRGIHSFLALRTVSSAVRTKKHLISWCIATILFYRRYALLCQKVNVLLLTVRNVNMTIKIEILRKT